MYMVVSGRFFEILTSTYIAGPGPHGQGPAVLEPYGPGPYGPGPLTWKNILSQICSRSIASCSWSSVRFKYDPGASLT